MKVRLPLYAQFIIWFFLNLVLLAICAALVIRSEFRMDRLFAHFIGDRAEPVAESLISDLRSRPIPQWTDELARYSSIHGVQFLVARNSGEVLAGPRTQLPAEVVQLLARRPSSRPPRGPEAGEGFPGDFPPPGAPRPPRRSGPEGILGFVRSSNPTRYWLAVNASLPDPEQRRPTLLLIQSNQLSGGGFFFNYTPWLWAASAVVIVSALWWIPFVGSITRSIGKLTAATERIAEGHFDDAVSERRGDELGRLGSAINQMSTRLGGFVLGQKRFLGDIAHELCSPLARLEMALGILDQRLDANAREYVQDAREEVRHMSGLVNELLSFSKAGLRHRDLPMESVHLRSLVEKTLNRECPDADQFILEIPDDIHVSASRDLLARAIGNLVRNALRHAGAAGPITLSANSNSGQVRLLISDLGPGVPDESLTRLGEPFYRPDAARTREDGGVGLGLAIVRSCVEACQGAVLFRNRKPAGFEAELTLKAGNPTDAPESAESTEGDS